MESNPIDLVQTQRLGLWPIHFTYRRRSNLPSKRHRNRQANCKSLGLENAQGLLLVADVENRLTQRCGYDQTATAETKYEMANEVYQIVINLSVDDEAALRAHAREFAEKIGKTTYRDCDGVSTQQLLLWLLDDTLHLLSTKAAVTPRSDGVRCLNSTVDRVR